VSSASMIRFFSVGFFPCAPSFLLAGWPPSVLTGSLADSSADFFGPPPRPSSRSLRFHVGVLECALGGASVGFVRRRLRDQSRLAMFCAHSRFCRGPLRCHHPHGTGASISVHHAGDRATLPVGRLCLRSARLLVCRAYLLGLSLFRARIQCSSFCVFQIRLRIGFGPFFLNNQTLLFLRSAFLVTRFGLNVAAWGL